LEVKGAGDAVDFGRDERADDRAAMAVIASDLGIGNEGGREIVVVFPGKVK